MEQPRDLFYLLCMCLRLCAIYIFYRVERKFFFRIIVFLVLFIVLRKYSIKRHREIYVNLCITSGVCGAERTMFNYSVSRAFHARRAPTISEIQELFGAVSAVDRCHTLDSDLHVLGVLTEEKEKTVGSCKER